MIEDPYADYPKICSKCEYLTYNRDDYEVEGDCGYDDWYTCSCKENSDNEYDLPWDEDTCEFKVLTDD